MNRRRQRTAAWHGVALALIPLLAMAAAPVAASADTATTSPFDAYLAGGDASCVELTVATGYSFIVEPDARLPRATATISEGTSGALAAPADPGDSVDALMGLLVPREEGQAESYMPQGLAQGVQTVANPVNPDLEYQYEHANAQYPNAQQPGDQQAGYLGLPSASFSDPSGLVSVDGTSGEARAGATYATAESGIGAATSLAAIGLTLGRVTGEASAEVTPSAVVDDVSCTLEDLTLAPPGSGHTLHIGSLQAAVETVRPLSGAGATSTKTFQVADVTLDGKNLLPVGQGGLPIPKQSQSFPAPPPCPAQLPPCAPPAWLQSFSMNGTTTTEARTANGNEVSVTLTGATFVLATTAPVPSSIPPCPPPNPPQPPAPCNPLSTTPVAYTLQLANLDSQAYGLPATPPPGLGNTGGSTATGVGTGVPGSYAGAGGSLRFGGGSGGSQSFPGVPGKPGNRESRPLANSLLIPGVPGGIRWAVVALAGLLEAALVAALYLRRRALLRGQPSSLPASSLLDLP